MTFLCAAEWGFISWWLGHSPTFKVSHLWMWMAWKQAFVHFKLQIAGSQSYTEATLPVLPHTSLWEGCGKLWSNHTVVSFSWLPASTFSSATPSMRVTSVGSYSKFCLQYHGGIIWWWDMMDLFAQLHYPVLLVFYVPGQLTCLNHEVRYHLMDMRDGNELQLCQLKHTWLQHC